MKIHTKWLNSIKAYYQTIQEQYSITYLKEALIAILLIVCVGGGYFLNKFYVTYREQQAFVALSEVVESFMQSQRVAQSLDPAKDKEKITQAWSDTEILLDALYKEHSNSYLAPYFLVFKSQIVLDRDKNLQEAIKIFDQALKNISRTTALGSLYHMKRIKMGFDSADALEQEKSLQKLIEISKNSKDYAYQEALYLLGVYYLAQGDQQKSQESFKALVDAQDTQALLKSPWARLAEEKLGIRALSNDVELK